MHKLFAPFALLAALPFADAHAGVYRVEISDDLRMLGVQACFDGPAPTVLLAGDDAAADYLRSPRWVDTPTARAPRVRRARMTLNSPSDGTCLHYEVDVGAAADAGALRRSAWAGDDLLTTPELWLWRTPAPITLEFALPDGVQVSTPWPRSEYDSSGAMAGATENPAAGAPGRAIAGAIDGDGETQSPRGAGSAAAVRQVAQFYSGSTPIRWSAQVAFGRFEEQSLALPGGRARVALLAGARGVSPDEVSHWIGRAADGVAQVYGRFPRSDVQILVVPGVRSGAAVPWAQVLRGGAPAAHFFIAADATADHLEADWTASHELSHLLLPFVQRRDAWLSEGFATYYQNVTRARAGLQSPQQAWRKLLAGFARGAANTNDTTLRAAAGSMHRTGSYMRVYWSGAAIALLADVMLRERSHGELSLDRVLGDHHGCCMDDASVWSARRLFDRLDELGGGGIFARLYAQHVDSADFPDVAPILSRLGVSSVGKEAVLDDAAPLAALRNAIMAGETGSARESRTPISERR